MKQMKKIASLLLALALIMGLAVSASAVEITVNNATATNHYDFYRVFDASVGAGTEIAYTVNPTYQTALKEATGKMVGSEIVAYVAGLDADGMRTFADALYKEIKEGSIEADKSVKATGDSVTATGLETGYYLVAEQVTDNSDTVSLVMLNTAGKDNITITTKEDEPTVEKWIVLDDGTKTKSSEVSKGEDLEYEVVGTVSNKYANYEEYTYRFVDDCSGGLKLLENTVVVKIRNGSDEFDVTNEFTKVFSGSATGFTLEAELKKLDEDHDEFVINGDTEIVVTYSATCNGLPVKTGGYYNNVKLQFENDPYNEEEGTISGETPTSRVTAFGFKLTVNKVDGNDAPLPGAGFTLYKWNAAANEGAGAFEKYGDEIKNLTGSQIEFPAMKSGKYMLVETTVPAGYNKAEDMIFTIEHTPAPNGQSLQELVIKDSEGTVISGLAGSGKTFILGTDSDTTNLNGIMSVTIKNEAGSVLPSTGGIGTTIFYVVGSILVLAAVVLLVTKKRMANAA